MLLIVSCLAPLELFNDKRDRKLEEEIEKDIDENELDDPIDINEKLLNDGETLDDTGRILTGR